MKTDINLDKELREQYKEWNKDKRNEFFIMKNTTSLCYEAEDDGVIINGLHNSDNIHYKKGDWICRDPKNKNDIWPIAKSLHQNYSKL